MKTFRLYECSMNRNSFGLRGAILVARDGEAWEVGANDINCPQRYKDYNCPTPTPAYFAHADRRFNTQDDVTAGTFAKLGCEIPRRLPPACQEIIDYAFAADPQLN